MTAKVILTQKAIPSFEVRFVSFFVDLTHDTPAVLKQYASVWKGDETRWLLLSTDRKMLYHTAAGMRVAVMPTDDTDDPVLHSSLSSTPSPTAVDPVCGMAIKASNDTPHAEHVRQVYHFCSDHCRLMFTQNPTKYVGR